MRAGIIDGKAIAEQIKEELKDKIRALGRKPKLVIIWVGENPVTAAYIRQKEKVAAELGINFEIIKYEDSVTLAQVKRKIIELNLNKAVDGLSNYVNGHQLRAHVIQNLDGFGAGDGGVWTEGAVCKSVY